jgi:hypothetical protein
MDDKKAGGRPAQETTRTSNDKPLPLGAQPDVTPFAIADRIGKAQAAVQRAALELIAEGVTPELRAHMVAAERALGAALWAVDYILAEGGAPC